MLKKKKKSVRQQRFLAISFQMEFALGKLKPANPYSVGLLESFILYCCSLVLAAFLRKTIAFWELNKLPEVCSDLKLNITVVV